MTKKKVKDLKPGDRLVNADTPVHRVCFADQAVAYVLFEGGRFTCFHQSNEVEVEPRTVAAKDAEGLKVCWPDRESVFLVEAVGLRGASEVVIGGHFVRGGNETYLHVRADQQLEVAE